jgi:putative transport protein
VLLGLVPVPLPGGLTVKLGLAGGPLIVALVLGLVHRTGPIVWSPPFAVHQTLRQCGAVLFLAGVGTRGGYAFATVVTSTEGLILLAAGTVLTLTAAAALLWIGHRRLGIPLSLLAGLVAGFQTQPAVLSFALEQTGNDLPNVGYAAAYPVATISKIILAQALLAG